MMKFLLASFLLAQAAWAGESSLTATYQPLAGLGSGVIHVVQVTCHDWYGQSGQATQISLISARNVPPTNNPEKATEDLNLASVCGLRFGTSDLGNPKAPLALELDATGFSKSEAGYSKEDVLRASLECLRRCLPEKLMKVPVTLKCKEADETWMEKLVEEFNRHDRSKVFYTPRD